MTPEQWDVHWFDIWVAAMEDGATKPEADELADRETPEQFGPRPEEAA